MVIPKHCDGVPPSPSPDGDGPRPGTSILVGVVASSFDSTRVESLGLGHE